MTGPLKDRPNFLVLQYCKFLNKVPALFELAMEREAGTSLEVGDDGMDVWLLFPVNGHLEATDAINLYNFFSKVSN